MYGICTNIWVIYGVNVGKYSIHGASGKVGRAFLIGSTSMFSLFVHVYSMSHVLLFFVEFRRGASAQGK